MENNEKNVKIISKPVIIWVIILNIVLFAIWTGFCLSDKSAGTMFVKNFPKLLESLILLSGTIFGVTTIKSGIFNKGKGGTPYYPNKISPKVIDKIIMSYFKKSDLMDYNQVINIIINLQRNKGDTGKSQYFEIVLLLQELDLNFIKVWNNFNYYETKVNTPNRDLERKYDLRKYIYYRVVDIYNKDKQK